ncbi:MAG: hypothetical protein PHT58_00215 [Eubacteriales bacterium]|nr:hypothetical protein [Eubacteriales bacterium]
MIPVSNQWACALIMLYGGMIFALAYRLLRSICYGRYSRIRIVITDALIVVCFFVTLSISLLLATFGTIRAYALAFYFIGFIAANTAFMPIFTNILKKIHKK